MSCNSIEGDIDQKPVEVLNVPKPSPPHKHERKEVTKQDSVLICNSKNAYAFHSHYCSGLSRCKAGVSKVTKSEAESRGRQACKICY